MRLRQYSPLILIVLLLIATVCVVIYRVDRQAPPIPLYLGVPEQRKRIDDKIAELALEPFDTSVNLLSDNASYHKPGYHSPRLGDQVCLETALSNRRCVKLINTFEEFSRPEADKRCRQMFDLIFERHKNAIRTGLRRAEDVSAPANNQSIRATQLGICAIMLITAQYASTDILKEQFAHLDVFRAEIETRFSNAERIAVPVFRAAAIANLSGWSNGPVHAISATYPYRDTSIYESTLIHVVREFCVPDARAQLNILNIHVKNSAAFSKSIKEICNDYPTMELSVANWNANMTVFDPPHWMEGIPLDKSKGLSKYVFYDWPYKMWRDNKAQSAVVDEIRSLVLTGM